MPEAGSASRALGIGCAAIAALALAVAAERGSWPRRLSGSSDGGRSRLAFLWLDSDPRDVRPRAFLMAHEFSLARVPARARLSILGDGEYVVWLNERRIGSGRYRADGGLDHYEVAGRLVAGANRLVVELRSATGSGAGSLRLEDEAGRILADAGPDWTLHRSAWPGLLHGEGGRLPRGEAATVIGRAPFGRWGDPAPGPERPLFGDAAGAARPRRAQRYRLPAGVGRWTRLPQGDQGRPGLGPLVEFDFGREVFGYLSLAVKTRDTVAGLVRYGVEPTQRSGWSPDAIAIVMPRRASWSDVEPRRFRYVEVAGLNSVRSASVHLVAPAQAAALEPGVTARGLAGIEPPPARLPIEDEIWKRLERMPRRPPSTASASPRRPATIRSDGAGRTPEPSPAPGARRRPAAG